MQREKCSWIIIESPVFCWSDEKDGWGLKNLSGSVLFFVASVGMYPCLCKIMLSLSKKNSGTRVVQPAHENVVFDPRIYVAEKEGCLLE